MLASLEPFAPKLRRTLATATDWRRWALFEAPALPSTSAAPVTLIGDAAHPILPFLAQGGALALEDAVTLAAAIAGCGTDVTTAFRAHEQARRRRTTAIAKAARRNGRIYHLGRWMGGARDLGLSVLPGHRIMAGYDWIYGWRP